MNNIRVSYLKIFSFGGEIFNIFEQACFHNEEIQSDQLSLLPKGNPFRTQAYSNILKILLAKYENFQIKKSDSYHISAQNIEPPR